MDPRPRICGGNHVGSPLRRHSQASDQDPAGLARVQRDREAKEDQERQGLQAGGKSLMDCPLTCIFGSPPKNRCYGLNGWPFRPAIKSSMLEMETSS